MQLSNAESPAFWASPGLQTRGKEEGRSKDDHSPQVPTLCPFGIGTRTEVIT